MAASRSDTIQPPAVAPVPQSITRPLWSVMIPTYNCANYLRETLESVLVQDLGPELMQIEVVDDYSTADDPEVVVNQIGKGRVSFYRKPKNEGATKNFNTCIQRSKGELVHILHGDDYVAPGFYQHFSTLAKENPSASLLVCRANIVDEVSQIKGESPALLFDDSAAFYYQNPIHTPCVVIRRSFYEAYGGFMSDFVHVADWEMWIRALATQKYAVMDKKLAFYRSFGNNDTSRLVREGKDIQDYLKLVTIFSNRYEDFDADEFQKRLRKRTASRASKYLAKGDKTAAKRNAKAWWQLFSRKEKVHLISYALFHRDIHKLMRIRLAVFP